MKTIAAGQFKATCLALMDEVQKKREPVLITKNGKPVARLVPVEGETDPIFGFLADKVKFVGDVISPVASSDDWDALK